MRLVRSTLAALFIAQTLLLVQGASADDPEEAPFITEAYYRVKWGHFDEFMELFKKNHYPILEKMQKLGHIESMSAAFPLNHASEESRWDFRMTIVIPDSQAFARALDGVSKELYPDQDKLKRDERHRFSLLTAHTDIVVRMDDLSTW
ncbi:MAG: hypothetical protein JRH16_06780 [Deltaproteobacteria bacterium]|nr:hypothetical protein [Deltaproteobacteria bacterium]MBW2360475.1 hypothetical protein [Deltaproteobacteria bacterium]